MASIRTEAQDVLDTARNGIGWIAVWKNGRSWRAMTFWPDDIDESGNPTFDDFDMEGLRNIVKMDSGAVIVNSYWHNLGDTTCMTHDSLADALRWQYERKRFLIDDMLPYGCAQPAC